MNVAIYKPNSKNTGCAFSFRVSTQGKLPVFYVNAIQQHSWDDKKKTGSFIKNKDWTYHNFRNFPIKDLEKAINYFIKNKYFVNILVTYNY